MSASAPAAPLIATRDRFANLLWAAIPAAPIGVAAWLTPDAAGVGTHRQLGLPACTFLALTGLPCPFCGMTTAWCWAAHLHPCIALRTQPMGFLLFAIALGLALSNVGRTLLGRPAFRADRFLAEVRARTWWSLAAALLVSWVYKAASVRGWI